jgi:hypothetical protein
VARQGLYGSDTRRFRRPACQEWLKREEGLVERLFAEHRRALQTFFSRRIRKKSDAPDVALRAKLRVGDV